MLGLLLHRGHFAVAWTTSPTLGGLRALQGPLLWETQYLKVIEEKMGDKDVHVKCSWDGDPASWQDYIRKVRLTFEKTRSRKRKYLGPELVSQLTGRAWTVTQEIDHRMLVQPDGARFLIEFLEQRLGKVPVPDAGTKAEELFVKMRRPAGMSMASWCHKVRETYRGLQRALKRARVEQHGSVQESPGTPGSGRSSRLPRTTPTSQRPTPTSPRESPSSRRRSSKQTVDEPEGDKTPPQADDAGPSAEAPKTPSEKDSRDYGYDSPAGESEVRRRMRGKGRGSRGREDSDTDTEDILAGIKVWDDLDTGLPEVLPTELVGWLMLRRCSLSSQQRLNIFLSVGNSLKAEDIERGLRGAEEELRLHDREQHPKGGGKKGRPVFWMEHGGEWALLNASEEDMDDWTSDVHWIGGTQELASNYGVLSSTSSTMTSAYGGQDDGVWFQDADGGQTWWERDADTGEYYTQDTYGVYWSWNDWEAAQQHAFFTEDQLKELSEAYAAYEGKLRTFAESRNLMRDKVMNRGFYPSKGKFKGKKGKPRPSSSTSSSKGKGGAAMAADAMATVGSPNYSGCFICGSRDHEFRNCPKKSSNKAGKGGGIYMVSSIRRRTSMQPLWRPMARTFLAPCRR